MDNTTAASQASSDFNKAKNKALFTSILHILNPEARKLLSFDDVKSLIKTKSESYRGMQTVKIKDIAGSEGRYNDFNKAFLPKKEHLRKRWERVDKAYMNDVILPPILLYKIGSMYFVRDGNHRVSVARLQGVHAIDAEVIELTTEIDVKADMTLADLKKAMSDYERGLILEMDLDGIVEEGDIHFTAPGRYREMLQDILGHKYFINMDKEEEIPLREAARSWYETLYKPVIKIITEANLGPRFPGRTPADMYIWIVKQWHYLKEKYGPEYPLEAAAAKYSEDYGFSFFKNPVQWLKEKIKASSP